MGKGCNGLGRILVRIQGAVTGTQWTMYTRRTWFFLESEGRLPYPRARRDEEK